MVLQFFNLLFLDDFSILAEHFNLWLDIGAQQQIMTISLAQKVGARLKGCLFFLLLLNSPCRCSWSAQI